MSPLLRLSAATSLLVAAPAWAAPADEIYHETAHGDTAGGVARDPVVPVGSCKQCHSGHGLVATPHRFGLFAAPANDLCFACHDGQGPAGVYQGRTPYLATEHWQSGVMLWPGPVPPARPQGDQGLCLNCHTPHGTRDGLGLVPVQGYVREEALCLACHDASGPAGANIAGQLTKSARHPVSDLAGRHDAGEGLDPAAFTDPRRHAECTDCHNPHAAASGAVLARVSRVSVVNGPALTTPIYVPRLHADPTPEQEFEICFKCHSSYTTLPAGARDLAYELNPANASFHPVEAAGKNTSSTMAQSLAGGGGVPHLTTASVITCSDCHGSEGLPQSVSVVSSYLGSVPTGPHGSSAATSSAFAPAILRAAYRTVLKTATAAYQAAEFALCTVCHAGAPFADRSGDPRADTAFRFHGYHLGNIAGNGSFDGDITTPGAGRGNAICAECHYSIHGSAGAFHAGNRSYARLVSFAPNATGPGGSGEPTWAPGSCRLRCHGKNHSPETY